MNKENPKKYTLQLSTYEAVSKYSADENVSFRQSSFTIYSNFRRNRIKCGFNLKSQDQFYNSLKRFKSLKL